MKADIAIVGAGMAGASLAAELAPHASILLLEAEDQPGYHSTGRSAAFWSETYGGPGVQPLTTASGQFLAAPPPDFSERPFLTRTGAVHLADEAGLPALEAMQAQFAGSGVELLSLGRADLEDLVPGIRSHWRAGLREPSCADIDVAALHAAYLRAARRADVTLVTNAPLKGAERSGGGWRLETGAGSATADILVNAAGAWADPVAALAGARPLGVQPYRRTVVQLRTTPAVPPALGLVEDILGRFYFKPESGRLWLSPHDETACDPCDCAPEELDIATAIDRFEGAVDWRVDRVERSWAGLRSFAPDRLPVYGFDPATAGFFWCAGQGGFGIQTAPAAARMAAALLLGHEPSGPGAVDPARYTPSRFG